MTRVVSQVFAILLLATSYSSARDSGEMVGHGGFPGNFGYATTNSALDLSLTTCLAKLTSQSVDVVFDLAASTNNVNNYYYFAPPPPNQGACVAPFLDAVSASIPQANFYAVILHGNGTSQTRYYLSMANAASLPSTTTTASSFFFPNNRRRPNIWGIQQPTTIGSLVRTYLDARATGAALQLPTSKPTGATPTVFTVVITDGAQQTPITSYPTDSIIVDISSSLANASKNYRTRNVLIGSSPNSKESMETFVRTIRYQICQSIGGISA